MEFYLKLERNVAFEEGMNIIWKCIERKDVMGDINYRIRMLQLRGRGIFTPQNETSDEFEKRTKKELLKLIDDMQNLHFEIVRNTILMNKYLGYQSEITTLTYDIRFLLQNGKVKVYHDHILNDAIY